MNMQGIVAKCGNRCDQCPLYVGNFSVAESDELNAGLYKYHHNNSGTPPHYQRACDGCLSGGYIARQDCPIRECVDQRGLQTCAECEELFCDLLEADMQIIEGAVARYGGHISPEDYNQYLKPFLIRETLTRLRSEKATGVGLHSPPSPE
jgi:hypothetical protein